MTYPALNMSRRFPKLSHGFWICWWWKSMCSSNKPFCWFNMERKVQIGAGHYKWVGCLHVWTAKLSSFTVFDLFSRFHVDHFAILILRQVRFIIYILLDIKYCGSLEISYKNDLSSQLKILSRLAQKPLGSNVLVLN